MWFSFLLVVFGALFDNFSYLQSVINERYYGTILVAIGIIVAVLRFLTTGPMK
jgi:DNA-directed RNA polymerase subunit E'/Rpb7